jgi:hypothetical protein
MHSTGRWWGVGQQQQQQQQGLLVLVLVVVVRRGRWGQMEWKMRR